MKSSIEVPKSVRKYLSQIGSVGGKKSKRILTPDQARAMVRSREKKRKEGKNEYKS